MAAAMDAAIANSRWKKEERGPINRALLFVPFFQFLASRSVSKSGSHNLKEIS